MTKKEIAKKFAELRKYGYKVFSFNSNRYMNKATVGFPDYVVIKCGFLFFIEVKLNKDKYTIAQQEVRDNIGQVIDKNKTIVYKTVTEKNVDEVINEIYYFKIY